MIYLIDKQDVDNIAEAIRLNLKESNSTNDLVTLIFNYTPDEEFSSKMNDFDMYSLGVLELNCDNIKILPYLDNLAGFLIVLGEQLAFASSIRDSCEANINEESQNIIDPELSIESDLCRSKSPNKKVIKKIKRKVKKKL